MTLLLLIFCLWHPFWQKLPSWWGRKKPNYLNGGNWNENNVWYGRRQMRKDVNLTNKIHVNREATGRLHRYKIDVNRSGKRSRKVSIELELYNRGWPKTSLWIIKVIVGSANDVQECYFRWLKRLEFICCRHRYRFRTCNELLQMRNNVLCISHDTYWGVC